ALAALLAGPVLLGDLTLGVDGGDVAVDQGGDAGAVADAVQLGGPDLVRLRGVRLSGFGCAALGGVDDLSGPVRVLGVGGDEGGEGVLGERADGGGEGLDRHGVGLLGVSGDGGGEVGVDLVGVQGECVDADGGAGVGGGVG